MRVNPVLRALLGAALLLCAGLATADEPAWSVAPLFGGDVRSLAFDPGDPDRVFAGTSGGHVYLSTDAGDSWNEAGRPVPFPGWVVAALRFDPNQPSRLWTGMWGVWGGGAIAFSDDGGRSWRSRHAGLPGQIYSLALVAGREGWLYAGTRQGVYRSTDGGANWTHATERWPEIQKVTSLWVDPRTPDRMMAGTWRRAYVSEDGGLTWRGAFEGMVLDSEVFTLNAVPGRADEMWASTCGWVYQSLDRGESWTRFREGLITRRVPAFRPLPDGQLLAGTVNGLFGSTTGGLSWQRRTSEELSILDIAFHPARPARVLIGTEGAGVWVSQDGARSFRPARAAMINVRVAALTALPAALPAVGAATAVAAGTDTSGEILLVAVNHAGPGSGVYRSRAGGAGFEHEAKLPTVLALASDGERAWAATEGGLFERSPVTSGQAASWVRRPELAEQRIEELTVGGSRVVARTAEGLFERGPGGRFSTVLYRHGPPRSAALLAGALWVADGQALYRLSGDENHTVSSPFAGGRLVALGELLLLAGDGGLWSRKDLAGAWVELGSEPVRALATGNPRHPLLVLRGEEALLLGLGGKEESAQDETAGGAAAPAGAAPPGPTRYQPLALDVPTREVVAAQVTGDAAAGYRLWIGTISQGLRSVALTPEPHSPSAAGRP